MNNKYLPGNATNNKEVDENKPSNYSCYERFHKHTHVAADETFQVLLVMVQVS